MYAFQYENMHLLTPGELNMYRHSCLCGLYKLAKWLMDRPVDADKVFKETDIGSFSGAEQEVTDNLVEDAILNEKRHFIEYILQQSHRIPSDVYDLLI